MANLEQNEKFASQEYWDKRFSVEEEFDWLGKLDNFLNILQLEPHSAILVLGCGNSTLSQQLENLGHFVVSTDYAASACRKQKIRNAAHQYVTSDCRDKIGRSCFDLVLEKGVMDAFLAAENPWSPSKNSSDMIRSTIEAAKESSTKFVSISFHSPLVRLPLVLSPDEYDVSIKTYEAALEFYAYIFDFGKRQESILPTYSTAHENDYDERSLSEDSEGFLGCIDID